MKEYKIRFSPIGLHNFLHDLQDAGLQRVRFRTNDDKYLNEWQLTHAAPQNNPDDRESFTGQLDSLRPGVIHWIKVGFWRDDNAKGIKLVFDLRKNSMVIEGREGLSLLH